MLEAILEKLSVLDAVAFVCGDLGYTHDHDHIRFWLDHIEKPVIAYDDLASSKDDVVTFAKLDRALYPQLGTSENASPINREALYPLQRWYLEVYDKPLEELTLTDICIACRQRKHLKLVVPLALDVLATYPMAGYGELALALRGIRPRDWEKMPKQKERLMQILQDAQGKFEDEDGDLKPEPIRQ